MLAHEAPITWDTSDRLSRIATNLRTKGKPIQQMTYGLPLTQCKQERTYYLMIIIAVM